MKRNPLSLAPSSAARWMLCSASPQYLLDNADKLPDSSNAYSEEGTKAHELAHKAILAGGDVAACATDHPKEMVEHVQEYADFVLKQDGEMRLLEQKIPLWYLPSRNGYVDACVLNGNRITIIDLKYGVKEVEAEKNRQLFIYAKSMVDNLRGIGLISDQPYLVHMVIYQPRSMHGPTHKSWALSESDQDWIDQVAYVEEVSKKIVDGDPSLEFFPSSETCRWCPASGFCEARVVDLLGVPDTTPAKVAEESFTLPDANVMSDSQLSLFVAKRKEFVKWVKDVEEYCLSRLSGGHKIEGLKLVEGRPGNRAWADKKKAENLIYSKLKKHSYQPKTIITPTQAERLLKSVETSTRFDNKLKEITVRKDGSPTLAVAEDPRPEISVTGSLPFDNNSEPENK